MNPSKHIGKPFKNRLCWALDGIYLLWVLISLLALLSKSLKLAPISMFAVKHPSAGILPYASWLIPLLAFLCLLCGFIALLINKQTLFPWILCLPAHAAWSLIQKRNKAKNRERNSNSLLFACLALQFLLLIMASGHWASLSEDLRGNLNSSQQNDEAAYLGQLLRRIDVWFLSLKGISAGLAVMESSTVEVGAIVYGSVSIGKIVVPIRDSLERISDVLFYGRLLLTGMQIVQKLGQQYAVKIILFLFGLSLLAIFLPPLRSNSSLWHPHKLLLLVRVHLVLFLLISLFFEPGLHLADNILQKTLEHQEENVLEDLNTQYFSWEWGQGWSNFIGSVQQWLADIKTELQDLGQRLLYFTIVAVLRTIALPLLVLFLLFSLYKVLIKELFSK